MGEAFLYQPPYSKDFMVILPCCMYYYERSETIPFSDNVTLSGSYTFNPSFSSIIVPESPSISIPDDISVKLKNDIRIMVASNRSTVVYTYDPPVTVFGSSHISGANLSNYTLGRVCWGTIGGYGVPGYGRYGINITEEEAQAIMDIEVGSNSQYQVYGELNVASLSLSGNTLSYDFSAKLWGSNNSAPHKNFNFAVVVSASLS